MATTSQMAYGDPRARTRSLRRQRSLPTSAGRRAGPQCKDTFKLEKLPTGQYISVPRHGELSLRRRHSTGSTRGSGLDLGSTRGAEKLHLTADMYTPRLTGRSEVNTSFDAPSIQPWMRGNTKRFGNTGPWVSNRAAAVGAAPSVRVPSAGRYLAGTQSVTNETYKLPYGEPAAPEGSRGAIFNVAQTLRIGAGSKLNFASVAPPARGHMVDPDDLDTIIAGEDAQSLTASWLGEASVFENEIVAKMFRDVKAKMGGHGHGGPPGKSPVKAW